MVSGGGGGEAGGGCKARGQGRISDALSIQVGSRPVPPTNPTSRITSSGWNASPAKIFMGDTGSLALGGALAGLAITSRTQGLLALLGGLFVVITLSVILQVGYFKLTKGRRIFRMAPLQHHFELIGWGEVTIVIRFWIIAGLCVASGLGLFYGAWVSA